MPRANTAKVEDKAPAFLPGDEYATPRPITAEEQAIAARVAADADGVPWKPSDVEWEGDYALMQDIFDLPAPAKVEYREKRASFRWIERTPRRLDEIRNKPVPFRWYVCNSTNTPYLKAFIDPVLGCVCREDQMLVMKPWWMRDAEWKLRDKKANAYANVTSEDDRIDRSRRSIENDREISRQEIRGGDIIMAPEEMTEGVVERSRNIQVGTADDGDLSIDDI